MFEKDCLNCQHTFNNDCPGCDPYEKENHVPIALYTAYLQAQERADKFESYFENTKLATKGMETLFFHEKMRAERYRQALNCPKCGGRGCFNSSSGGVVIRNGNPKCPACAEIRKEARGK